MSSKTVDITKVTVDDIFRAKEERRRRLASLPFDQKIVIVNKLRAAVKAIKGEKAIFASFLRACPDFASEPIVEWEVVDEWYNKRALDPPPPPFDKRPDVIAITESGKKIGIELKNWINQDQIDEAKKEEKTRDAILKAIGPQQSNETKHIGYVRLWARQEKLLPRDAEEFRKQIFALVGQRDTAWSQKPDWEQEQLEDVRDFTGFPILKKYLHSVEIHPWPRFPTAWIQFPSRGGAYSPTDMLGTLNNALTAHTNDDRYNKDLRKRVGLDEVYLLVHYDSRAFAYNTPFAGPNFGFEEAAEFASKKLAGNGGHFDRVFLSCFLLDHEEGRRIV